MFLPTEQQGPCWWQLCLRLRRYLFLGISNKIKPEEVMDTIIDGFIQVTSVAKVQHTSIFVLFVQEGRWRHLSAIDIELGFAYNDILQIVI